MGTYKIKSRNLLLLSLFLVIVRAPSSAETEQRNTSAAPVAAQLQAGDLIWPKKPGVVVPFNSQPGEADNEDAMLWQQEKEAYLDTLRKASNPTEEERERYSVLQPMGYEEFAGQYLDDRIPGEPTNFGVGGFYVGHVGIIDIVDGKPMVIEALMGKGVRRITYEEWLQERLGELIWWARLKDVSPEKRAAVAKAAAEQIGKPYQFWNFNLTDASGFYCSKLAWYSVLSGTGFPVDDNPNPNRALWFSPKRLMRSRHIEMLANPGSYGSRN